MQTTYRDHTCADARPDLVGRVVTLSGWVNRRRDLGSLIFLDLRDRYGMTQVVVRPGQTLWSIAAAAEPSANTWTVVQQITQVNALNGPVVRAGQLLWVPKG